MRSALAVFILILLALLSVVVLLAHAVNGTFLNPQFLKRTLAQERLYDVALAEGQRRLATTPIDHPLLAGADVSTLVPKVVSAPWLQQTVETVIDAAAVWLKQPPGTFPALALDLREPKQQLSAELGRLVDERFDALPVCERRIPEEGELCRPVDATQDQLRAQREELRANFANFLRTVPDTVDLAALQGAQLPGGPTQPGGQPSPTVPQVDENLENVKAAYQQFRGGLLIATGVLAALLIVYILLILRGLKRTLRWVGAAALALAVLPLAIALASAPVVTDVLLPKLQLPPDFAAARPTVVALIDDVQAGLVLPFWIAGVGLLVLGVGALVVAPRLESKRSA